MKLTSFAYNLYDGVADHKNVFPSEPHADKRKAKVYSDRQKFAIQKLPNLLEFFGYAYFIVAEKELTFRKSQLIAFVVCNLALFAFGFHLIVGEH